MNETRPLQKQDVDRIVRVLEQILAVLKESNAKSAGTWTIKAQ